MSVESLVLRRALERSFATFNPLEFTAKVLNFGTTIHCTSVAIEGSPSDYEIRYHDGAIRALERFDFEREWNNLGYGLIGFGEGPFDLSTWQIQETQNYQALAEVFHIRSGKKVSDYMGLIHHGDQLELWCLRPVGPVDGFDWTYIEDFVSFTEIEKYGGCPLVHEVPAGYRAGVFMRIDCDEAIQSGRSLFELYRSRKMPFSMAIKTDQPIQADDLQLITDVLAAGGSIVSHSHTHEQDWGMGNRGAGFEIEKSHALFRSWNIPGIDYRYVVSPFHKNSPKALTALADAGIQGFVGGIACNDPDALVYRSGNAALAIPMLTVSTQCMLHGVCYHAQGSKLNLEKQALSQSIQKHKLFGYLDHPLSNYFYGWQSPKEQLEAHSDYLDHIDTLGDLWKPSLVEALDFTKARSMYQIRKTGAATWERFGTLPSKTNLSLALSFGSKTWAEQV